MDRKKFLSEVATCIEFAGFKRCSSGQIFTYKMNVRYPSKLLNMKSDYAHFILYTSTQDPIQIVVKFQESSGTAIEKLAYNALDAANCEYEKYLIVCGGKELLKGNRALDFLNKQKNIAPKLLAVDLNGLKEFLNNFTHCNAA